MRSHSNGVEVPASRRVFHGAAIAPFFVFALAILVPMAVHAIFHRFIPSFRKVRY